MVFSVEAQAQTVQQFTAAAFKRSVSKRKTTERPNDINLDDCLKGDVLSFDVKVISPTSHNFEVWVGNSDCTAREVRVGTDARCWLVYKAQNPTVSFTVDIPVRNVVARKRPRDLNNSLEVYQGTVADCSNVWEESVTFYFMYVNDLDDVQGTHATWSQTNVDLRGPTPPTEVRAGVGDQSLVVSWKASKSGDLTGYNLYCATNTGAAPAVVSDAGGVDGGTPDVPIPPAPVATPAGDAASTAQSCGAAGLVPGKIPTGLLPCGTESSKTATGGFARRLENGVTYAVAVAGVDALGNPGELSSVACNTPQNLNTFFDDYVASGGEAGGGICSVGVLGTKSNAASHRFGALLMLLLSALFLGRKRS